MLSFAHVHTTHNILFVFFIVSLRQFDSKGDYYYVLCRFGRIVLLRTNDQITFRYISPRAELSEMRM